MKVVVGEVDEHGMRLRRPAPAEGDPQLGSGGERCLAGDRDAEGVVPEVDGRELEVHAAAAFPEGRDP